MVRHAHTYLGVLFHVEQCIAEGMRDEEVEHSRPRLWLIIYIFHTRGRVCYIIYARGRTQEAGNCGTEANFTGSKAAASEQNARAYGQKRCRNGTV